MYHMVRCTNMLLPYFVYFTPLHTLYIFSDYNALNIQLGRVTETLAWWQRAIFFSPHSQQPLSVCVRSWRAFVSSLYEPFRLLEQMLQ